MNQMYTMIGISKQGHYKRLAQRQFSHQVLQDVLTAAKKVREEHPRMGCRKLYHLVQPKAIGRDRFEQILLSNGFRVKKKKNYHRTTYASVLGYDNLISGVEVGRPDQVYVSDITYIPLANGKFLYLTLVQDLYSRMIVGDSLSKTLQTEDTVVPAYLKAIAPLSENQKRELVFHSDRGSQYYSNTMKLLHRKHKTIPSMGGKAWENAHAESLNGVLKNEYLLPIAAKVSFKEVESLVEKTISKYNFRRPHGSLKNMKPVEFKTYVQQLAAEHKPIVKINY